VSSQDVARVQQRLLACAPPRLSAARAGAGDTRGCGAGRHAGGGFFGRSRAASGAGAEEGIDGVDERRGVGKRVVGREPLRAPPHISSYFTQPERLRNGQWQRRQSSRGAAVPRAGARTCTRSKMGQSCGSVPPGSVSAGAVTQRVPIRASRCRCGGGRAGVRCCGDARSGMPEGGCCSRSRVPRQHDGVWGAGREFW
jgi:hypothetical protein